MKTRAGNDMPSDEVLTAFLDGELGPEARIEIEALMAGDAAVRARMTALEAGGRPFRAAFDHVLENAPQERLDALLAAAVDRSSAHIARPRPVRLGWGLAAMAGTLLLLVGGGAGFMLGHSPPDIVSTLTGPDRWLETVADQMSLYSADTLAHVELDPAEEQARLERLGAEMNLTLSPEAVALPGLSLKRIDLLEVDRRPLLQLVYQGEGTGPLALCIIRETGEAGERSSRRIAGMNMVYWTSTSHGFLLVSSAPAEELTRLADVVDSRLPQ